MIEEIWSGGGAVTDILVVEDDEAIANLICVSLSAEGYRCTCARAI